MLYCTKHGNQCDCPACVREQFAETLVEASIKRLKLYNRIKELEKMSAKTVSAFDHMLDEKDRRIKELERWNKIDETESDKLRNRIEELESQNTFWACKKHTQQNTLRCAICDEQHIKELVAKLEAATDELAREEDNRE